MYRQPYDSYFTRSQASDNVFRLITLLVVSFIFQWLASTFFYGGNGATIFITQLGLQFNHNFHILQIFTHPLLHTNLHLIFGLLNVLFTILILFFFGSDLERTWGGHHFLRFFLFGIGGSILLGFFVSYGLNLNLLYHGIGGGNAALMLAYAIFWPEREVLFFFFIPMRMKWFIVIIFGLIMLSGGSAVIIQYSGGALAAAIFLYYYARKNNQNSPLNMSVVRNGIGQRWQEYQRKKRLKKKQQEIEKRIQTKAQVDTLLEKISKNGIDSLDRQEKKFLDKASQEY